MNFDTPHISVDRLLSWVRTGRVALPEFQRSFVWGPSKVSDLLDSIAKQWPIGSMLLLRGPHRFGFRAIELAPEILTSTIDYYVLDGQQRITSIYHALADQSEYRYFVDFGGIDLEEGSSVKWMRRKAFEASYPNLEARARSKIALISDIWTTEGFYAWLHASRSSSEVQGIWVSYRDRRLKGLQSGVYKLMAIELERDIELEALAKIFETINTSNEKLGAFDLLVAMLYPQGFNLREKWDSAKSDIDILNKYDPDPTEIIKLIALIIRSKEGKSLAMGVRQGDLLRMPPKLIAANWDSALDLYERALQLVSKSFGAINRELVPSWSLLLGLCAWLKIGEAERVINRWYWSAALTGMFSQAANTRIVSEFEKILQGESDATRGKFQPEMWEILDENARSNGMALRAFAGLLVVSGARDPLSDEILQNYEELKYCQINFREPPSKISQETKIRSIGVMTTASFRKLGRPDGLFWNFGSQGVEGRIEIRSTDKVEDLFRSKGV